MHKKDNLIFFCTYYICESIIREYNKLKNSIPDEFDVVLVINNEETKLNYEYGIHNIEFYGQQINCLIFDKKLNDLLGLKCFTDKNNTFNEAMWYDGDYRAYYVKHFFPDYKYYWYIEYDIYCNGNSYAKFLNEYKKYKEDLLIPHFRKLKKDDAWCWIEGSDWAYEGKTLYGSFFPIFRLSAQSIDYLYKRRKELADLFISIKEKNQKQLFKKNINIKWIFCELFIATEIINGGFTAAEIVEENLRLKNYNLKVDKYFKKPDFKIYHPVKPQELTKENKKKSLEIKQKFNFTIVIPVHNGMPFIKDCIQSALAQNYPHYNIIVLENQSTDGTTEYLDALQEDKITIIKSKKLLSIEENWARIKDLSLNEYMTILMADDKLEHNYLSLIAEMIEKHPNCNIYRTNICLMDEKSKIFHCSNIPQKVTIYDYLAGRLKHTYTETAAGYCFKTKRYKEIGGIDCKYRLMHTDDKLFMQAIGENNYMAVSASYGANYRCHTGSESGNPNSEAAIAGYNYWLNWIYNLNDPKLRRIVRAYLPYHLTQIVRFFPPEEIEKHKEIYKVYNINEKDLFHRFINYKARKKLSWRYILEHLWSIKNQYRNGKKRKVIRILGIKIYSKCTEGN